MHPRSLWEFRGVFDEDDELQELNISEVVDIVPVYYIYILFLEKAAEDYTAQDPLCGMG
jgi:hypothetical protein